MIRAVFDKSAQTYDRARQQLVPGFDDFYEALLSTIPNHRRLRILDLGTGTGLLSLFVSQRLPQAKITLWTSRKPCWLKRVSASLTSQNALHFWLQLTPKCHLWAGIRSSSPRFRSITSPTSTRWRCLERPTR